MNIKELRIGNKIWRPCCYDEVVEIRENGIIGLDSLRGLITYDEVTPIPITEELLEKCGFERNNDMPPYILDLDKARRVYMFKNAYGWILQYVRYGVGYDETVSKNIVMFVHQLQNAYYLATGKELEIKL